MQWLQLASLLTRNLAIADKLRNANEARSKYVRYKSATNNTDLLQGEHPEISPE